MRDWHCHILPGVDDGSQNLETSLEMAKTLSRAGFREVFCTPHRISGLYATEPAVVHADVAALQSQLDVAKINLKLWAGMEYYLDEMFPSALENPCRLGETNRLLVEAPSQCDRRTVLDGVSRIVRKGLVPLIAHPERSKIFGFDHDDGPFDKALRLIGARMNQASNLDFLLELRGAGCLFQGNLGSFSGYYGKTVRQRAFTLLHSGIYSCFGSDGHTPEMLTKSLPIGINAVGSVALT